MMTILWLWNESEEQYTWKEKNDTCDSSTITSDFSYACGSSLFLRCRLRWNSIVVHVRAWPAQKQRVLIKRINQWFPNPCSLFNILSVCRCVFSSCPDDLMIHFLLLHKDKILKKMKNNKYNSCQPPSGKTYLTIGQDFFSIQEYLLSQYNASLEQGRWAHVA